MPPVDSRAPLILVATGTSNHYVRGIMAGIRDYVRDHEPWELLHIGPYTHTRNQTALSRDHDGVIGLGPHLQRLDVPLINVADRALPGVPRVYVNDEKVAELAAQHLLGNGWVRASYVGPLDSPRWRGLSRHMTAGGASVLPPLDWSKQGDLHWAKRHRRLCDWLEQLPPNTAVLAYTDNIGAEVLEAAHAIERPVPDDLALIGVNDDLLVCEFVSPPLSSIALPVHRVGYEAAAMLDRFLAGHPPADPTLLIDPIGLVPRRSTQHQAVQDPQLRHAMQHIVDNLAEPLTLDDLATAAALSPRSLQRRFQKVLGRSPSDEIRRVRVETAKRLLIETQMSLAEIAAATGYLYTTHLSKQLKKFLGCSPMAYRKRYRSRHQG